MKQLLVGAVCMGLSCSAMAMSEGRITKKPEASMVITGLVDITPDGHVRNFDLDKADKIPSAVVGLVKSSLPNWKFDLTQHIDTKAKVSLRVVARPVDDQHETIGIVGASFTSEDDAANENISYQKHPAPEYPQMSLHARVAGEVYVYVQVGRNGKVQNLVVSQVNLAISGDENELEPYRHDLAVAASRAVKRYTFNIPTTGPEAGLESWTGIIPVAFYIGNVPGSWRPPSYGQWSVYVPGPTNAIPWIKPQEQLAGSTDAVPAGGSLWQSHPGVRLVTPLATP
ncbi:MAG: hypothetical protein ABI227_14845 [Rhodanobacter sp.]